MRTKKRSSNKQLRSPKSPKTSPPKSYGKNRINKKHRFLTHVFKPVQVSGSTNMNICQSVDFYTYTSSPKIHIGKQKYLKERKYNHKQLSIIHVLFFS